jgi:hypothetical protein
VRLACVCLHAQHLLLWWPVVHAEQWQQQQRHYVMFGSSSTAVTDKDGWCDMRLIVQHVLVCSRVSQ